MTIQVATPLRAYLSECGVQENPHFLDAETIVRELIRHAGVLAVVAPSGDRFALVALPPHLLNALSAYVPAPPQPLPLFDMAEA